MEHIKNEKKHKKVAKFWKYFYSIIMIIILCIDLFLSKIKYRAKIDFTLNNFILLIIGIVLILCIFLIISKIVDNTLFKKSRNNLENKSLTNKKNKKYVSFIKNKKILIWTFIFTIILFFLGKNYNFETDWDVKILLDSAKKLAYKDFNNFDSFYYSLYPGNLLITFIFTICFLFEKITKINATNYLLLLNSIVLSWSGFLYYKIAEMKFKNKKLVYMVYVLYLLIVGLSPWLVIPYSDVLGIGILSIVVYCYLKIYNSKTQKEQIIFIILTGFFGIISYYIKPQTFIFTIAIVFLNTLKYIKKIISKNINKMEIKKILIYFSILILTYIIINILINYCGIHINPETKVGIPHYLMLGANEDAGATWNQEDIDFSNSFSTVKERNAGNMKIFKERIKQLGVNGVLRLWIKKTLSNYNDGTFSWGCEGTFYVRDYYTGIPKLREFLEEFYWSTGKNNFIFRDIAQALWLAILFFSIFIVKSDNKYDNIFVVTILGLTLFELLFECRARYLFSNAPIYILISVTGINELTKSIKERKEVK